MTMLMTTVDTVRDHEPMASTGIGVRLAGVRAMLERPDAALDSLGVKLALDRLVDAATDAAWIGGEVDRLADAARALDARHPGNPPEALRMLLYVAGAWNGHRPFAYNHAHPLGTHLPDKLLGRYLVTRRGNCVSMPILHLILAERLGMAAALATVLEHVLLQVRTPDGRRVNLEATSGGRPARDDWYRRSFPMSDRAVAAGTYLRPLSRREAACLMAETVLQHALAAGDHAEAAAIGELLIRHAPRDAAAMVTTAYAYGMCIETGFARRDRSPLLVSPLERARCARLARRHAQLMDAAEALGWTPETQADDITSKETTDVR